MKHFIQSLGVVVDIPDGWYVVTEGSAKQGDMAWSYGPNTFHRAVGYVSVDAFHCLIRKVAK